MPHLPGKSGVMKKRGGVPQPLLAILRQFVRFQLGDGGKLVVGLGAEILLVIGSYRGCRPRQFPRRGGQRSAGGPTRRGAWLARVSSWCWFVFNRCRPVCHQPSGSRMPAATLLSVQIVACREIFRTNIEHSTPNFQVFPHPGHWDIGCRIFSVAQSWRGGMGLGFCQGETERGALANPG